MKPNPSLIRSALYCGAFSLTLLALTSACGGGGGGDSGTGSSVDVLVGDAPADELLAFHATATSLRLVRLDGAISGDALAEDIPLELLGLTNSFEWLTHQDVTPGTYTGMLLGFVPGSYEAIGPDGSTIAVTAVSNTLSVEFASPFVVTEGSYDRLTIDVDLAASLSGNLGAPPLVFDPSGTISDDSPADDSFELDELKGLVKGFSALSATVNVQAYVDDDLEIALDVVQVELAPSTLLVDDDGVVFASQAAFFAALVTNQSVLEVHGGLDDQGHVVASKIEIDDQSAGSGSAGKVRIEGLVLALDSDSFELAIAEVEKGASIALPVLATLGNPGVITVGYDSGTKFYLDSDTPATSAELAVGQKVDVRFVTFTNEPFPASKVEIDGAEAEFEGTVTDVSGSTNDFEIHLYSTSHWIPDSIASSSTDVTIDAIGTPYELKTEGEPSLVAADLVLGLKVEVEGSLTGGSTPSVPVIDASKVKVKAGRLEGTVSALDVANDSMTVVGTVHQTFGDGVSSGTVIFELESNCVYEEDAETATELQALFDGLQVGETLVVRVEGIGSGTSGHARAYYVRAKVED
jgi:hypothetical protein